MIKGFYHEIGLIKSKKSFLLNHGHSNWEGGGVPEIVALLVRFQKIFNTKETTVSEVLSDNTSHSFFQ